MNKKLNIKETGFKTPENYFEGIEDAVFSKLETGSKLKSIDNPGFKIPDGYLDTVEDNVLNKIDNNSNTKVISLFSRRNLIYMSGVAAALLIMFGIFNSKQTQQVEELNYDMVEAYIIDQDISTFELASMLTDDELSMINTDILIEAFNESSVEDYLLEHVDLETIIEQ